jgi:hypothetical protein
MPRLFPGAFAPIRVIRGQLRIFFMRFVCLCASGAFHGLPSGSDLVGFTRIWSDSVRAGGRVSDPPRPLGAPQALSLSKGRASRPLPDFFRLFRVFRGDHSVSPPSDVRCSMPTFLIIPHPESF